MLELYITGVEKNENKIFITSGLASTMQSLGYSTAVYKPFETGVEFKNGTLISQEVSFIKHIDSHIKTYHSYQLQGDMSPILSAASEGLVMEKSVILKDYQKIQDKDECLIIDGLSGLGTPISVNFVEEDVIKMINAPLLFIASANNPDISNIILSAKRAKELSIDIRGVIITDYPKNVEKPNVKLMPKLIEEYADVKILGMLPVIKKDINPEDLIAEILNNINIENVFNLKISKL